MTESRIEQVAPILRSMVQQHESNTFPQGVEAFNTDIENIIDGSGLLTEETRQLQNIATHPDNREGGMLVPIDVHQLLMKFAENGFNPKLWDVLALRVPAGWLGDAWKKANHDLVSQSDDLLCPFGDQIEVVTGRGSHSCSALRLVKFGGKSIYDEIAGPDGRVSRAKFLALQPSWAPLLDRGVKVKVLPAELEMAVPGLLACLSRTGNASHDVFRVPTSIQFCSRIHALYNAASKLGKVDWPKIAKQAVCGNGGASQLQNAEMLCDFVRAWSGGANASLLREVEQFERSITVKRKVFASDLQALSTVDLLHAPKYVAATYMGHCPTCLEPPWFYRCCSRAERAITYYTTLLYMLPYYLLHTSTYKL